MGVAAGMSSTKNKRSSSDAQLDRLFRALGDQTRRALLTRLARGPAMITELAEPFGMSFPAVSRHIRVLEGPSWYTERWKAECIVVPCALSR